MIDFKRLIKNDPAYSFLYNNEHLGDNICLIGLGIILTLGSISIVKEMEEEVKRMNS